MNLTEGREIFLAFYEMISLEIAFRRYEIMKKAMKVLLVAGCVWLWGVDMAGTTLSRTWAKLKSENEDKAADVLEMFAKEVYIKPVVDIFEATKNSSMKEFKKD